MSPEALALMYLLGMRRADADTIQREALRIIQDVQGERWTNTLSDLRSATRTSSWLRAIDAAVAAFGEASLRKEDTDQAWDNVRDAAERAQRAADDMRDAADELTSALRDAS